MRNMAQLSYRYLESQLGISYSTLREWKWLDRSSVDAARGSIVANGKGDRLDGGGARQRRQERKRQRRQAGSSERVRRPRPRRERAESQQQDNDDEQQHDGSTITMTIRSESLPDGKKVVECQPEEVKMWADIQRALASSDSALANARKTRYTSDQFVHGLIDAVVNAIHRRDADVRARTIEQWFGRDLLRDLELCESADERRRLIERSYRAQVRFMNEWQDDDLVTVLRQAVTEG